ncbi:MAG: 5-deoxy-glucuronate isomerase [Pseudomonadota bacterium]
MHIPPYDNQNRPIVDCDDARVPLTYFNIVKLTKGQRFTSVVPGYETCLVPATGTIDVLVDGMRFRELGGRGQDVWDGEPEGAYIPPGMVAEIICDSPSAEIFVAGAKFDTVLAPFEIRARDLDIVQYGSDETKTHRKIKHILGKEQASRVGRLLVSELYTVGAGGWSGFPPHKHDQDRKDRKDRSDSGQEGPAASPIETRHNEVYNFRFKPDHGFGMQLLQPSDDRLGQAYHIVNGSSFVIDQGYHPCVAAPGYSMYYFTILGGLSQRPLVQYFQPEYAWQVETIPGIKDMIAKFR